jgi:hypothetical protein
MPIFNTTLGKVQKENWWWLWDITNHIGNNTPDKKENARQKKLMEDSGSSILIGVNNAPLGDYF